MRTASDGRGDDPGENPVSAAHADDESTRVFTRGQTGSPQVEATRAFVREPGGAGEPAPDHAATRAFTRDQGDSADASGTAATRAFTRPGAATGDAPLDPTGPTDPTGLTGPADHGSGSGFTRRFVRERPGSRGVPATGGRAPTADPHTPSVPLEPQNPGDPVDGSPGPGLPPLDHGDDIPGNGRAPRRARPRPAASRRRGRRRVRVRWVVALVLLTLLALPPGTWAWVWYTARQDDRAPTDAIVVLGASQYNGVPSPIFEARLRHAQSLYQDGVAPMIVTVGGKQPGDNYTEAGSGRNWLIEVGVPADQIIAVEEGRDTLQSIRAVAEVFEVNDWDTATLVSDPWHSLRSQRMAHDHGIEAGTSPSRSGPAVIERRTQLWYITRETVSLWYYWIFNDSSDIRVDAA
ncbi:YdcF family protein [Nocardiopsis sp. FIRDI 009]|uniref:YdcF family protein n=1 Tax=Nocardiopsis sp. FIRDI 009 TaxID=714197 RepID=UPI000E23C0DE|nr:YdcF family protein [Nocardiopsis sp. FIRDI 009]